MIRLSISKRKKEIFTNKLMDLANLLIVGISVASLFTVKEFNVWLFLSGIVLCLIFYFMALFIVKD